MICQWQADQSFAEAEGRGKLICGTLTNRNILRQLSSIIVLSLNVRSSDQLNMSNHSLLAQGTDAPFSHESIVSITHEQNIICNKTLVCRQLFVGHMLSSRPMKRKEKIHRMIMGFTVGDYDRYIVLYKSSMADSRIATLSN